MILDIQAQGLQMFTDELPRFLNGRSAVGIAAGDGVGRTANDGGLRARE